nr:pseudouridylate synthase PUS7L isoform X3 [Oryctolagus cuniculus]
MASPTPCRGLPAVNKDGAAQVKPGRVLYLRGGAAARDCYLRMEEDADYIRFSSVYFLNDHIGFHGTIKNSPKDFIVTEIDEQGQLVSKPFDELTTKSHIAKPHNFAKKPKLDLKKNSSVDDGSEEVDTSARCSDGDPGDQCDSDQEDSLSGDTSECKGETADALSAFLDDKTNELLSQFALETKEKWNAGTEQVGPPSELFLGVISGKRRRAALHSAITQKFPFLLTTTKTCKVVVRPNLRYKELCDLVSEEEASGFFKYLGAKKENSRFAFKPDTNKERRRAVHHFVNERFGRLLETESSELGCCDGDQKLVVTVRLREEAHSHRKRSREKVAHTAFTLRKENVDMFEAIDHLAAKLGVIPPDFSYTGLKDKKAITYQAMVVRKVTPERLKSIEKEIAKKGMNVFNVRSVNAALRLGQLKGNHFDIVIRNVRNWNGDPVNLRERILEAIENVKNNGFVNYYGPEQLEKERNVHADQIGLALLKEEMVKSVKLFLTPEDVDDPVNRAKKYFLQTEDAKGTLELMPEFRVRERELLELLHRFSLTEEGCTNVWYCLPHHVRTVYVHAYLSQVWNEAASYRLEAYGTRVVEGDLVCLDDVLDQEHCPNSKVHLVTKEEELANTYTIYQVVLPVLGHSTQYPGNLVGQWYQELLSRDGLQTCGFRVPALNLNMPGCYRQILKQPHNLCHQLLEDPSSGVSREDPAGSAVPLCLCISFDLDASCCATVFLKEMMKHDI